jgi:hypothetical protein
MREYRDEIAMVCHDMMKAGQSIGAVSAEEMRKFEEDAFAPEPEPAQKVPETVRVADPATA